MKKQAKRSKAASKPRAIQTSRHWRLSHRRHSGHVLPKRSTSYPILVMIVLCTGVFLAGWTRMVTADQGYDVQARVAGQAPTQAATIDLPLTGSSLTTKPILVSGTCPLNTYVDLLRNNVSGGVALCDGSSHYSLSVDLLTGSNTFMARVYNFADTPGPDSAEVAVSYQSPVLPATTLGSSAASATSLTIKTNFKYQGFNVGDLASWKIEILGGIAPYAVNVEWGDGEHDLYSRSSSGEMTLEHRYKKAGGYKGSYVIKITATDNNGANGYAQFITIINNPSPAGVTGLSRIGGVAGPIATLSSDKFGALIKYAWPSYGVVSLMLTSFWLGELRELHGLRLHPRKIRR